ncbi:secreted protein [Candidatus Thiomargarita nelsonii]|uniref:Secreted protein n=1 Tax=Candidatus Thiomargarita nelsonii TaxID=1003181 RepID=A0A176RZ49_9GAMM|nr:secreted protein [Candidatus Thiomargarita nelsonii]
MNTPLSGKNFAPSLAPIICTSLSWAYLGYFAINSRWNLLSLLTSWFLSVSKRTRSSRRLSCKALPI